MWEINITDQILTFIYSFLFGIIISLFYGILSAVRRAFLLKTVAVFFLDMFFWTVNAFTVFLFLLSRTNGEVRSYVLIGILLGFISLRVTLLAYIIKIITSALKFSRRLVNLITEQFYAIISLFYHFLEKYYKKTLFFIKKLLKKRKNS